MKHVLLFSTLLLSSCITATPKPDTNQNNTYQLNRITGDITLNGLMISEGTSPVLTGLSENLKKPDSCAVAAGQYYPSSKNEFGRDGNFMTKVHLEPQILDKDAKPQCSSNITIKKGTPFYFLAETGEGWFDLLYEGKVNYCLDNPNFPSFKQPKVDEWFKVNCSDSSKKIWVQMDDALLKKPNICRLEAAAPDYGTGSEAPTTKGNCK